MNVASTVEVMFGQYLVYLYEYNKSSYWGCHVFKLRGLECSCQGYHRHIWINEPVGEANGLGFSSGGLLLREVSGTVRGLPM